MRFFIFLCLACCQVSLFASAIQPRLSADSAEFEFVDGKRVQVARGNVRLVYGDITVFADQLQFDQESAVVTAVGSIILDSPIGRTKAETLNLDLKSGSFSMTQTTLSRPPIFLKSESAIGSREKISMSEATASYQQPDSFSPNLRSKEIIYYKDGKIDTEKTLTRVGIIPLFYLPSLDWTADQGSPIRYYGDFGYRGELGLFLQNKILYKYSPEWLIGASIDFFTERGVLFGPELEYDLAREDGDFIKGSLSSGYLNDRGETGVDIFENPIDQDRGFFTWKHSQKNGNLGIVGQINYWGDSEVTRDFRPDQYNKNQQPQNYLEIDYLADNTLYSFLAEFSPNGFQNQVTRLPQARVDLLLSPILQDQFYHKGFAEFSRLKRETAQNSIFEPEVNRFDAYYGWNVDYKLKPWMTLTGIGGGRVTHYTDSQDGSDFTRVIGEFGLDLRIRYEAIWEIENKLWQIQGLRHLAEPVIQYRYIPAADAGRDNLFAIDRNLLQNYPPLLDLSDQRFTDQLDDQHIVRIGHENTLQTRSSMWGSRSLAQWNIYQDVVLNTERDENALSNAYSFIELSPIDWFSLTNYLKWDTSEWSLNESYFGLHFQDGDIWRISLNQVFIENDSDQYFVSGDYRLSERTRLLSEVRFDADQNRLTQYGVGVRKKFGHAWDVLFTLTRFEGSRREGDIEFRMRINLVTF